MRPVNPFWTPEQQQAYTEVALIVFANGQEGELTHRKIVGRLGERALNYARSLPHGHDETFRDSFFENMLTSDVITYHETKKNYGLGHIGDALVINFLEEWAGSS